LRGIVITAARRGKEREGNPPWGRGLKGRENRRAGIRQASRIIPPALEREKEGGGELKEKGEGGEAMRREKEKEDDEIKLVFCAFSCCFSAASDLFRPAHR